MFFTKRKKEKEIDILMGLLSQITGSDKKELYIRIFYMEEIICQLSLLTNIDKEVLYKRIFLDTKHHSKESIDLNCIYNKTENTLDECDTQQILKIDKKEYDIGDGVLRSIRELSELSGMTINAIKYRIKVGKTGAELIKGDVKNVSKLEDEKYIFKLDRVEHDMGDGVMRSLREISEITGLSKDILRKRAERGKTGAELVAPRDEKMAALAAINNANRVK